MTVIHLHRPHTALAFCCHVLETDDTATDDVTTALALVANGGVMCPYCLDRLPAPSARQLNIVQ